MRNPIFAAATAAFAFTASPASAGTPVTETMTCPIGGSSFPFTTTPSYSTHGERPDGKPFGSWTFPLALPECPDNGLVLYKDYTPEEIARLEPLIASERYQALRKEDTPYYRAYWLMKEMGVGPERYLWALLQASWEAEAKPELRKRYLAELVEASAGVPPRPADLNWIGMEGRAINALRELGRFDEALARLAKVPLAGLDVRLPTGTAATQEALAAARTRRGWHSYFIGLKPAIERHDSAIEPLDLLPRTIALGRCIDEADKLDEAGRAFCEKESTAVAEVRESRDKLARELEALRQSREASGR
ncbi:MAG: hypothetical protein QOG72_1811 [Sphingomonadales bacterium]|jgi:hypothetical protein|nr:hypothetical protein [Sphingomonadales bacterium]